jgi:sulfate/thiosulfate-binding protein
MNKVFCLFSILLAMTAHPVMAQKTVILLNVSYDPTRELYKDINEAFGASWKKQTGDTVEVRMSNGGSGKQAQTVINGNPADVVTLGLAGDIDALYQHGGLVKSNWQSLLPDNSTPYTSTIVFLVRKGNPKGIKDWDDLVRPDVKIVTPNPKTSGGARWSYLAAYGVALKKHGGDTNAARQFVEKFFHNAAVLPSGAREATTVFLQEGQGDVLVSWENEALMALSTLAQGKCEVVYPSISILAEPPVAVVDKVVDKKGTRSVAEAYLRFLYTPEGQEIVARHYFRPRLAEVLAKHAGTFPKIELFTIQEMFGGWGNAQKIHFAEGGVFDQIYQSRR